MAYLHLMSAQEKQLLRSLHLRRASSSSSAGKQASTTATQKRPSKQCGRLPNQAMEQSDSNNKAVRARRASRPKVKTGCNNCKNRRVKCDETRPQCNKCVRSGRICEGYPAYRRASGEAAIAIAPRPQPGAQQPIALASPVSIISSPPTATPSRASSIPTPTSHAPKSALIRRSPARQIVRQSRPTPPPTPSDDDDIDRLALSILEPQGFGFDAHEGQYFQVFRMHTAGELSGFFGSDFWMRSVLQESHSEASIRHAVIALGALYKTLEKASESPPTSPSENHNHYDAVPAHYNFAIQHYAKAVTRLREAIQHNEKNCRRTVLISIVLFTCFQSFTGDHRSAIAQIQHGLCLLEERRQEANQPLISRRGDGVEDELIQIFTRLAIQAKSYDMAFHFPHPYVIRLTPKKNQNPGSPPGPPSPGVDMPDLGPPIPNAFSSTKEARAALDSLCEQIMRFNETLSTYYAGPNNILPVSVKSSGLGFRTQLTQWTVAFEPLLSSRRHVGVTNTERAGINVLKMISLMTTVLFFMGFSTSERDFDNFKPQFKEIVDLAKELVVDEELSLAQARCGSQSSCRHTEAHAHRMAAMNPDQHFPGLTSHHHHDHPHHDPYHEHDTYSHIKASFALDLGIVPPLFVVATKCRDRKLRRDAINLLLSSPRREGMWDSILSGRVASWIMEIEEEGMEHFSPWGPSAVEIVKDEKRVMVKEILFDLQRREATIRCGTRGAREGDLDAKAKETFINW